MKEEESFNLLDEASVSKEFYELNPPKLLISEAIRDALKRKNLSLRKAAELIEGMSYTQICRVTSGENYNINTLLKILAVLDLEIVIQPKELDEGKES